MGKPGQARQVFRTFGRTKTQKVKTGEAVKPKAPKLKKNIVPGSILILLTGRFRGSRVVFLKQLESGLLLVTGPYGVNGVPLKRVPQTHCIGTSTKVELGGADFGSINDAYFSQTAKDAKKAKKAKKAPLTVDSEVPSKPTEMKEKENKMDEPIIKGLSDELKGYLKTRFALSNGMYPHEMKF